MRAQLASGGVIEDTVPFAEAKGFEHTSLIGVCKSLAANKKRSGSHVRLPVLMSDWTTGCSDVSIGRCETA